MRPLLFEKFRFQSAASIRVQPSIFPASSIWEGGLPAPSKNKIRDGAISVDAQTVVSILSPTLLGLSVYFLHQKLRIWETFRAGKRQLFGSRKTVSSSSSLKLESREFGIAAKFRLTTVERKRRTVPCEASSM